MIACVGVACIVSLFREGIATLLAFSAPGISHERAAWIFSVTLLTPMAQPAQPLPSIVQGLITQRGSSLILYYILVALVFLQAALLVRRVAICVAARRIVVPPALGRTLAILLLIGVASWCIPALGELLNRLLSLVGAGIIPGFSLASAVFSAFVFPILWIPAMNLLGPIFFGLEYHSVLNEGILPQAAQLANERAG